MAGGPGFAPPTGLEPVTLRFDLEKLIIVGHLRNSLKNKEILVGRS
jgi:hypothetical protein